MSEAFRIERPTGRGAPVVVEVPHAGTLVPPEVRASLRVDDATMRRDADAYVDELYRDAVRAGAVMLVATASRYVVDLNRDEGDVDAAAVEGVSRSRPACPRGVIWRETGDGEPALRGRLTQAEYAQRVARWYRPYHEALAKELEALHRRHGRVVLLSAHSMPSMGRRAETGALRRRADVVPGTRGRTTAEGGCIDAVDAWFRAAGLTVTHDDPYRGGATTARWGRPREGFHAVQVEVNRALYMDEATTTRRPDGVRWLSSLCVGVVERLAAWAEG